MSLSHNGLYAGLPMRRGAARGLRAVGLAALIAFTGPLAAVADTISGDWIARWEEDLRFAQAEAAKRHPNLFHDLATDEWNREFDTLIGRLPELEHHEAAVELARIVARLKDGHTRLTLPLAPGVDFMQGHSKTPDPHLPELLFHQYPVRFSIDSNGVHVQGIAKAHRDLLGTRVTRLGRLAIDAAIAAVEPTIRRDNAFQVEHHLPMHMVLAELLHARGVIEDQRTLQLEVVDDRGETRLRTLDRVADDEAIEWADARDAASAETPLYLQHPERRFWFEHLKDAQTVYLQMDAVQDEEHESLREFAGRVESFIAGGGVDNLIVDLRSNRGGNGRLFRPLLHAILCSRVNRTGHLFVLIGRTTFSAAMMFTMQLEKHTKALFVGEPTGSSPNHYGDSRKIRLPNTGMTLRVSTLYWQSDPTDVRDAVAPHIPVELTIDDYRANRDPVVDTVLGIIDAREEGRGQAIGPWRGVTSLGLNLFELAFDVQADPARIAVEFPALELDTLASSPRVAPRSISFELEFRDHPLRWRGSVAGDWLIGESEYRTVPYPFVLRSARSPKKMAAPPASPSR